MFRRWSTNYALFALAFDVIGTLSTLVLAVHLRPILPTGEPITAPVTIEPPIYWLVPGIWTTVFFTLSVYQQHWTTPVKETLWKIVKAATLSSLVVSGVLYFSYRGISRLLVLCFYACNLVFLCSWRLAAAWCMTSLFQEQRPPRRVIIAGVGQLGKQVAETIQNQGSKQLKLLGFLGDRQGQVESPPNVPILGSLNEARRIVEENRANEVLFALEHNAYEATSQAIVELQGLPINARIVPSYLSLVLHRATAEDFGGLLLINLRDPAFTCYQRLLKRIFDLAIGTMLTIFSMPIMLAVAAAIKLDSPGPAVFKQQRVGENGRLFTMWKFRSMVTGAEAQQQSIVQYDEEGNLIHKVPNDPRRTRVGRFIRCTSLDELPQLFNVLKGDMSLVGPRPELPWIVEQYEPWQYKRLAVPQGITGWWQVGPRSDKVMHLHTEEDLLYIQNYSFLLDIKILLKTIPAVLMRKGAF